MKASDYIVELQKLIDLHGDLPVVTATEYREHGGTFKNYDKADIPNFKTNLEGFESFDKAFVL